MQDTQNEYANIQDFVTDILKELDTNSVIYNCFLPIENIRNYIENFFQRYVTHSEANEFLSLILNFLSYCKNQIESSNLLKTEFTNNYHSQFSVALEKLRKTSFLKNKNHLHTLNYIMETPKPLQNDFNHTFKQLNFDFSNKDIQQVSEITLKMVRKDLKTFSFLTNYLFKSCVKLEKNKTIHQI